MSRRFHTRGTSSENIRIVFRSIPWKLLLLLPVLLAVALPTFVFGTHMGSSLLPSMTGFFYAMGAPAPSATPTPPPPFPTILPQVGSVLYTVQEGDSCNTILTYQMRMADAGQVFSDAKPETVKALNNAIGHDCHKIQPGMTLPLSPHYPLMAFGGLIRKIEASTPQQVLPTPLINVPDQEPSTADCSGGCLFTVQLTARVSVRLSVETTLPVRVGSWIWSFAFMPRETIKGFATYPYVNPQTSLNGASLHGCNFEIDNQRDTTAPDCSDLMPNSIIDDDGAWLVGVTGSSSLDHWRYSLKHVPSNTRVMLWLSLVKGNLTFQRGNPLYYYDEITHIYQKV